MTWQSAIAQVEQVLALAGISSSTIDRIISTHGIRSLDNLRTAVSSGRLRSLKEVNLSVQHHILRCLDELATSDQGILMDVAHFQAGEVMGWLRGQGAVIRSEPVGAMRRGVGLIREVEVLAATTEPGSLLDAFSQSSLAAEQKDRTRHYAQIQSNLGVPVTLHVCVPERIGSALLEHTGCQDHLQLLRELSALDQTEFAKKINEPDMDETQIYRLFGLPFIPPELRQGGREIQIALEGKLPDLITVGQLRGDLHIHSDWGDGLHSITTLAQSAAAMGYEYIAISDHSPLLEDANGLDSTRLQAQAEEIEELSRRHNGLVILRSMEVDIRASGELDMPDESLRDLDLVIASIHLSYGQDPGTITRRLLSAIEHPLVDIIGHPMGRLIKKPDIYSLDNDTLLRAAARTGTALEINAGPDRLDLGPEWARKAIEHGVSLAIGSDAHSVAQLNWMQFGLATARSAWLQAAGVLNAMPLEQMRSKLKRNRPHGKAHGGS